MKKLEKLKQSKIVNDIQIKGGLNGRGGTSLNPDLGGGVMATFSTGDGIYGGNTVITDTCTDPFIRR